jgi:hypothetical protein
MAPEDFRAYPEGNRRRVCGGAQGEPLALASAKWACMSTCCNVKRRRKASD